MIRTKLLAVSLAIGAVGTTTLRADDVQYVEENGIKYQVTRQVVQRPITSTHYEPRQSTELRERYTTDMQEVQRTYQVPITQQQWVPGYQRSWNLFAPPVFSYRLMPITHFETRTETVRIPVTRRDVIPETRTTQVPVTTSHVVQDEHVHRVAIGVANGGSGAASVATRNDLGGVNRLDEPARDDSADQMSRRR